MATEITAFPALQAVTLDTKEPALQDLVFLNNITLGASGDIEDSDFTSQARAVFARVEAELKDRGMTKHHIVDMKSTLCNLDDLFLYNEVYDDWMTGVAVLPTQTACQCQDFSTSIPQRLAMSVTATKSPKANLPASLQRAGGGDPGPHGMHLPWSNAVRIGGITWLAGLLDVSVGQDALAQTRAVFEVIESVLGQADLHASDVIHADILIPSSLSEAEEQEIVASTTAQYPNAKSRLDRVHRTCLNAQVEICVIAAEAVMTTAQV